MSDVTDKAGTLHAGGCNCGQAVAGAFCEKYDVPEKLALKLAGGFGSGLRKGEVCGAAIGGAVVVGMKHGAERPGDAEQKKICNSKTKEFMDAFQELNGALLCRDLLKSRGKRCRELVESTAKLLEKMGY